MSINEWFFLLSFLAVMGITLFKAYNVARLGRITNVFMSVVLFIILAISWFVGLQVLLSSLENILYIMLHRLMSIFLILSILLLFAEMVMSFLLFFDNKGRVRFKDY